MRKHGAHNLKISSCPSPFLVISLLFITVKKILVPIIYKLLMVLIFYNFFLFTVYNDMFKDKQIHKTSKSSIIKSVDAKPPKTASNLLKPIE